MTYTWLTAHKTFRGAFFHLKRVKLSMVLLWIVVDCWGSWWCYHHMCITSHLISRSHSERVSVSLMQWLIMNWFTCNWKFPSWWKLPPLSVSEYKELTLRHALWLPWTLISPCLSVFKTPCHRETPPVVWGHWHYVELQYSKPPCLVVGWPQTEDG